MKLEKLTNALWKWQVIGWFFYFLLMFFTFLPRDNGESIGYIFLVKVVRTSLGFTLSCLLWLIYRNLIHKQSMRKTVLLVLLCSSLFGAVWTLIETSFFWLTLADYNLLASLQFKPRVALTYTVTLVAWSAIYLGIEYWRQVQIEQQNALKAQMLAEGAQLAMLRYQVNPHFLFNALNSIRASINPDNPHAKEMVTQLSEFLRHSLLASDKTQNTLGEELEAVENYLAIEKIRFEEALEIGWHIDPETKPIMLPSFILNPLVENAIKHGFNSSEGTLKIHVSAQVFAEKLVIEIKNTGKLDTKDQTSLDKIGLKNVQERLSKALPNSSEFSLFAKQAWVVARIEITL